MKRSQFKIFSEAKHLGKLKRIEPSSFDFNGYGVQRDEPCLQLAPNVDGYWSRWVLHYDFQPIAAAEDEVKDYSFTWAIPQAAGKYVVEVGLVPAQITAHDAAWLKVT